MGGNGPVVVMDDADLDLAVEATVAACFLCAGQSCTAGERLLVHRAVQDEFVERLARRVTQEVLLGRPVRRRDHDGPAEQRRRRGEDGRARRRRARARRRGRGRRRARERLPHRPLLAGHRARRRAGRRRAWPRRRRSARSRPSSGSARWTRRSSSPTPRPTGCWRRSSPATWRRACASPTRSDRLGQHQRLLELLGEPPAVRRALGHGQRASAASAARTSCRRSRELQTVTFRV